MAQNVKILKQRVRYEFYRYTGNGVISGTKYQLKLENPAEIKFICTGGPTGITVINNIYAIQVWRAQTLGVATGPSELILKNNVNEIDVTQYNIIVSADAICNVICKYYVNE